MADTQNADLLREAKETWFAKFDGASLEVPTMIGSPTVKNYYKRTFEITSRNIHFIGVFGRILLDEEHVHEPENHVRSTITNAMREFENKIAAAKASMLNASIEKLATYQNSSPTNVKIVSPIAKNYLDLLVKAEEYLTYVQTLWLHGAIDDKYRTGAELDVKRKLRNVVRAARNMFIVIRKRINEQKNAEVATEAESGKTKRATAKKEKSEMTGDDTSVGAASETAPQAMEEPEKQVA